MAKIDIKNEASPATPPSGYIRIYSKPDKVLYYKDDTGVETAIATVTNEQIQDAVGYILTSTASVVLTYDDAGNQIYATVAASGVNHNALSGYVAHEHINHSSVSINAGSGLTGGGDITSSRTISMPSVGTSGTYGSASSIPVITTDAQGRVSSVSVASVAASSIGAQPASNELTALASVTSTGFEVRTGSGAYTTRSLSGISGVIITTPDGVTGNPVIRADLSNTPPPIQNLTDASTVGTSTQVARADHTHAFLTTGVIPGTYGSASAVSQITANSQGQVTSATGVAIQIAESQVTNLTTDLSAKVAGPSAATDNALARFDLMTGKLIQNSNIIADDSGNTTFPATNTMTLQGDQCILSQDISHFRTGSWSISSSGGIYNLATQLVMWYKSHNAPVDASGTFLGREEAERCIFYAWGEDNVIRNYSAVRAAVGVAPVWTNNHAFDLNVGSVSYASFIRPGSTTDTTDGNLQYTVTNTEHLARQNSTWRVLGINPTILTATGSTSTTSATYATVSTMTTTPAAGTYLVLFVGTYTIGANTNGDFAVFVNGSQDTNATSNVSANTAGVAVSSTDGSTVVLITTATVTGSQIVDIRFRENGAGTLTTTNRRLVLIPLSR